MTLASVHSRSNRLMGGDVGLGMEMETLTSRDVGAFMVPS